MAKKRIIDDSCEEMRFQVMMQALLLGITPEDLKEFYDIVKNSTGNDMGGLFDMPAEEPARASAFPPMSGRSRVHSNPKGLKDAAGKVICSPWRIAEASGAIWTYVRLGSNVKRSRNVRKLSWPIRRDLNRLMS